MSGSFYPYTFAGAETYLAAGRSKHQRKVAHNTRLFRVDDETIVLVQHSTPIITFHADGTRTLWLNGYNTPTTRKRFSKYARDVTLTTMPGSWGCEIAVGYTGETTPPKVQKCRSCKGVGKWMTDEHCGETGWYYGTGSNPLMCKGATTEYAVPYDLGEHNDWHAHWESRHVVPCEHGHTEEGKWHQSAPCSHGEYGRHKTGEHESSCYRCNGEGVTDYGSKPIPITISTGQSWRVDAEGKYLGAGAVPNGHWTASEGHVGGYWSKPYSPPAASKPKPNTFGGEIADRLAEVLPGINALAKHPVTGDHDRVRSIIVNLNDSHRWSRERIADWLDTLDTDLRFPTPKETAA